MTKFKKYINQIENQDFKEFTKYLDEDELINLEYHFDNYAKQLTIHSVGKCKLLDLQTKIKSDNIEIWNKIKNIKVFDYNTSKLKVKYRQNKELLEVIQKNL